MSTITVAPIGVVKDLLKALYVGEEACQTFKLTRLDDDPPSVKFHDKMTKQRMNTFSPISTKTSRMKAQNVVLEANRNLFSQMILVIQRRSVNMKDVLAHCHGHWQIRMGPCEKQTRPQLSGSFRKMYLLQKLFQLHQPASLIGWVWYNG